MHEDSFLAETRDSYDAVVVEYADMVSTQLDDVVGIDLSPRMIELARSTYPRLRFEVGDMLGLELADTSLGGLLAYYSIIHLPWARRHDAFAEFHRVLAPGGYLMLGFQVGDDRGHRAEAFGKQVSLRWYRQQPDDIARLLHDTGFDIWATTVRQPAGTEKTPQCLLLARKSSAHTSGPQRRADG